METIEHKLDPEKLLTPAAKQIMQALESQCAKPRVVGGRVRDLLLGRPLGDIDIAVDVPPEETKALLGKQKIKVRDFGIVHGTVIAVAENGEGVEVTSLREDVKTDGRHTEVEFGTDWKKDAQRRDFTINALYADINGNILDPLDGMKDLLNMQIRFIGDPEARIQEDYLRILRFFRFAAKYGVQEFDSEAMAACSKHSRKILTLPKERVTHEIRGIFGAKDPQQAITEMHNSNILKLIFGDLYDSDSLEHFLAFERSYCITPNWVARWLRIDRKPEYALKEILSLTRKESVMVKLFRDYMENNTEHTELALKHGWELASNCLLLANISHWTDSQIDMIMKDTHRASMMKMPITAQDLLDIGVPEGREMGCAFKQAQSLWIADQLFCNREQLLERVRNALELHKNTTEEV